ncbi:hypothetical protein Hanom_Chr09g00856791 [Helianthus anomalus]
MKQKTNKLFTQIQNPQQLHIMSLLINYKSSHKHSRLTTKPNTMTQRYKPYMNPFFNFLNKSAKLI